MPSRSGEESGAVGPTATAFLQEVTLGGIRVLAVDHEGHAVPFPLMLAPQGALGLPDGGGPGAVGPTQTMLLADPAGRVAYATVDGHAGVLTPTAKVELGRSPCSASLAAQTGGYGAQARLAAGFAGLVPAGPRAFVVACESGEVLLVRGEPE